MGERISNLIFTAILFGLATLVIAPAGPTLASMKTTGVGAGSKFQGTPATKSTSAGKSENATRTSAAPSCVDKTKRYVDCGNGTVADSVTGLIWLKQSDCLSSADWETAKKAAAGLKNGDCMLTDGSSPGDWRLPTQAEWEATMEKALALSCTGPTLTNDAGTACITAGPTSFAGVQADYYWSSTTMEGNPHAWFGDLDHGHLLHGNLSNSLLVWPVRGVKR
jgi:hypothetical protein